MRRSRRRLRSRGNAEEEEEDEEEEEEQQPRHREYPTFLAMLESHPPALTKPPLEPSLIKKKAEEEITDAGRKRKREKSPPPTPLRRTAKEMLPPTMKKRIGENKTLLPLPPKSNLPLKLKMRAAQKIKKKYINMSYTKLSPRKKKEKKGDNQISQTQKTKKLDFTNAKQKMIETRD